MAVTFNLNDQVVVELTEFGMECFNDHYTKLGLKPPVLFPKNTLKIAVWEMAQIFGRYLYNGCPKTPFMDNRITFA